MEPAQPEKVLIKKYENRRLYDTAQSRYVNLEDVAEMVRKGEDVQVVDARTGEDLTRLILTQIIVEDAKEREFALPLDILRQLVVASGRASQEGFAQYMKAVSDFYRSAYHTAFGLPAAPMDFLRMMNPAAPRWMFPEASRGGAPPAAPAPAAPADPPGAERALAALRNRIEELEKRLADAPAAAAGKRKKPAGAGRKRG